MTEKRTCDALHIILHLFVRATTVALTNKQTNKTILITCITYERTWYVMFN